MTVSEQDEAWTLLSAHADRALTGSIEDPAVAAAVAGVERLSVVLGSTDPDALRAALAARRRGQTAGTPAVSTILSEVLHNVQAGLARRALGEGLDARLINADAGGHEIATDAELLRAAVRAAQRSYAAMPYYSVRYGERGSRFASTDSSWLVALAGLDEPTVVKQVSWLARVLSARGMPSWLLETHLAELVAEIRAVAGEAAVGALPAAARMLAETRRQHVADDVLDRADGWVAEELRGDPPVPRTGALMAATVADVASGYVRDDASLFGWLTDPHRVSPPDAVALRGIRARLLGLAGLES